MTRCVITAVDLRLNLALSWAMRITTPMRSLQLGEILVECAITPPSLTKDVLVSLHGVSRIRQATTFAVRVIVLLSFIVLMLVCVNIYFEQSHNVALTSSLPDKNATAARCILAQQLVGIKMRASLPSCGQDLTHDNGLYKMLLRGDSNENYTVSIAQKQEAMVIDASATNCWSAMQSRSNRRRRRL